MVFSCAHPSTTDGEVGMEDEESSSRGEAGLRDETDDTDDTDDTDWLCFVGDRGETD